jgi:hypothetical protein
MSPRKALIFLALCLPAGPGGCLHATATPEERRNGIDAVGSAETSAPIRVGVSTRSEVIDALGEPKEVSADSRAIAYSYNPIASRSGFVFLGGPCGLRGYYPVEERKTETLWLAFDRGDRLKSYSSSRETGAGNWQRFCEMASSPP